MQLLQIVLILNALFWIQYHKVKKKKIRNHLKNNKKIGKVMLENDSIICKRIFHSSSNK